MADGSQKNREIFEQAVGCATRAVSEDAELEVCFTADVPGLASGEARIAHLPHKVTRQSIAEMRGEADSYALKHRFHDEKLHRKLAPGGSLSRAIFDAVETARVEAIGARRMDGSCRTTNIRSNWL